MNQENEEDLHPVSVLIEELRGEDIHVRLQSVKKMATICLALGPERTRTQLMPFLTETIYDANDVLFALAEELGSLVPYVGGPEYVYSLLPPLENLAAFEETTVRDKAVESLRKLAQFHNKNAMEKYFNPLLHRLATGDWFTSRTSACALLSIVYPRVPSSKRWKLFDLLRSLSLDETPMVRRSIAARLGELALAMTGGGPNGLTDQDPKSNTSGLVNSKSTNQTNKKAGDEDNGTEKGLVNQDVNQMSTDGVLNDSVSGDVPNMKYEEPNTVESESTNETLAVPANSDRDEFTLDPVKERNNILTIIVPVFTRLIADEQESVRLAAVESIVQLAQALGPSDSEEHLVELVQQATVDRCWRVRCVVAEKFTEIQTAMGLRVARERLVPFFMKLLNDEEAEVRAFAAGKVRAFARCLLGLTDPDINNSTNETNTTSFDVINSNKVTTDSVDKNDKFKMDVDVTTSTTTTTTINQDLINLASQDEIIMTQLIPAIQNLTNESNTHVKSVLANAIIGLAPLIGKNLTIEHLLPIFLTQLNDENPEVRLNVISNLEQVNTIIGIDYLTINLLPAIVQLAEDPKWRIRLAIIEYMPLLAEQLGLQLFTNQLIELCLTWLVDQVYAIREAAVENLVQLCVKFGPQWASQYFIPKIIYLSRDNNYLHRMICLQSIISLCKVLTPSLLTEFLLPTVLSMQSDYVPNVRFKVAQALSKLGAQLEKKDIENQIKLCLNRLVEDPDADVKFYAQEAMESLNILPERKLLYTHNCFTVQSTQSITNPSEISQLPINDNTNNIDQNEISINNLANLINSESCIKNQEILSTNILTTATTTECVPNSILPPLVQINSDSSNQSVHEPCITDTTTNTTCIATGSSPLSPSVSTTLSS